MKKIIEILMIVLIALSYFSYGNTRGLNIDTGYYFPFIVGAIFIFLSIVIYIQTRSKFKNNEIKGFLLLILPELIVAVYTFFIWIIFNYSNSYMSRGISNILLYIFPIIQAFFIIYSYRDKGVDIIFKGTALNYTIILLIFIFENGLPSLINTIYMSIFDNTDIMTILEAHQVTFVLGLVFIYYLLNNPKNNKFKITICIIYLILGLKRILIGGIVVALIVTFILNKIKNLRVINIMVSLIAIISILFCYGWVYSIKSGILEEFSDKESIDFMSRFELYDNVSTLYDIEPFYWGTGIGYVSKWTADELGITRGLHSDLLKKYIEYGFIMYGVYLWYRFYYSFKKVLQFTNKKGMITYIALMLLTMVCWTTDNVAGYYMYLLGFNVIVLQIFTLSEKKEKEEVNEKDRHINII